MVDTVHESKGFTVETVHSKSWWRFKYCRNARGWELYWCVASDDEGSEWRPLIRIQDGWLKFGLNRVGNRHNGR